MVNVLSSDRENVDCAYKLLLVPAGGTADDAVTYDSENLDTSETVYQPFAVGFKTYTDGDKVAYGFDALGSQPYAVIKMSSTQLLNVTNSDYLYFGYADDVAPKFGTLSGLQTECTSIWNLGAIIRAGEEPNTFEVAAGVPEKVL